MNKTWTWEYDDAGNILNRKEYAYTSGVLDAATDTVGYGYGDNLWGDLLTNYDGNVITHDGVANPISDGEWTYTWEHGRQLASMSNSTTKRQKTVPCLPVFRNDKFLCDNNLKPSRRGNCSMLIYLQMIETDEDKSKFEELYEEYRGLMYHVAYKYLQHEQDAEDVVHHAFVKIAENIKTIEPVSPKTKQFVVTMVENRVIDLFRVNGRHPETSFNEEILSNIMHEYAAEDNLLVECIMKLPELQREVIWLKYHHGYDLHEISKMLGISLVWAQKVDQRAKKKLKTLYEEVGGYFDHR